MKPLGGGVLSMVLAVGLFSIRVGAVEKAGAFRGEGVDVTVKYWAGGVGHSAERDAAEQSLDYSVRILFATAKHEFLAKPQADLQPGEVGLVVTDPQGRVVFRIDEARPVILLGLPKGIFAFEGRYHGSTKRFERVAVEPTRRRDVIFVFPE